MNQSDYWKIRKKEMYDFLFWACDYKARIQDGRGLTGKEYILLRKFDQILVQLYDAIEDKKRDLATTRLMCLTQLTVELYRCNQYEEFEMDTLSKKMICFLRGQGRSQKQVADLMGISESYVSKVMAGERQFSLKHFEQVGEVLGQPAHLLLLRLIDEEEIPEMLRPGYHALINGLETCYTNEGEMVAVSDDQLNASLQSPLPLDPKRAGSH